MTTKKYVLSFIVFALLLVLVLFLLFLGLSVKETSDVAFYVLVAGSCMSLIAAIVFIVVNYKKLVAYDMYKLDRKISNLDFSVIDMSISESELCDKLIKSGYKIKEEIFHKVADENCGDVQVVSHYYAKIHKSNGTVDIERILEHFNKGMTTYNIGYIFINGNAEETIEAIKKYIKETILDVKMHAYRYNNFFAPIIIANNRIYYVKEAGIFMDTYKFAVIEGVRVVNGK